MQANGPYGVGQAPNAHSLDDASRLPHDRGVGQQRVARSLALWLGELPLSSVLLAPAVGVKEVLTSPEMWMLTKRGLKTEPLYGAGKWALEKVPPVGRVVKRWLGIDAPATYRPEPASGRCS